MNKQNVYAFAFALITAFVALVLSACSKAPVYRTESAYEARIAELEAELKGKRAAENALAASNAGEESPRPQQQARAPQTGGGAAFLPPPGGVPMVTPEGAPLDPMSMNMLAGRAGPHVAYTSGMPWTPVIGGRSRESSCDGWCFSITNYTKNHLIAAKLNSERILAIMDGGDKWERHLYPVLGPNGEPTYVSLILPGETIFGQYMLNEYSPASNRAIGKQPVVLEVEHYTMGEHSGPRYLKKERRTFHLPWEKPQVTIKVQ